MTHAMHRSAAYRGKPAVAETIHRADSAAYRGKPAVAETIHRAHVPTAMRNSARALEAVVAMRNHALAVSVLRMGFVRILRGVVRSMGFAYDLPEAKTGIVRNFSQTFTSFESRDHLSEAVARGFGQ